LIFHTHTAHIEKTYRKANKKFATKFDVFLFGLNFYFILDGGGGVHFKTFSAHFIFLGCTPN